MGNVSSSGQAPSGQGTLSLAPIFAAQAFGQPTATAPGGGFTAGIGGSSIPQLFTPEMFSGLSNLANPYQPFQDPGLFSQLGQQSSSLLSGVLPGIQQLSQTGFGDRISNLSSFLFQNDIAPQLEEQFGTQLGLDTGDADLRAALIREGQRSSLEAANQSVQNQILGLQMAQGAPAAVAEQAASTEQLLQQGARQQSPEGQLLNLLQTFGGVQTQAGGTGGGGRSSGKGWGI